MNSWLSPGRVHHGIPQESKRFITVILTRKCSYIPIYKHTKAFIISPALIYDLTKITACAPAHHLSGKFLFSRHAIVAMSLFSFALDADPGGTHPPALASLRNNHAREARFQHAGGPENDENYRIEARQKGHRGG